MADNTNKGGYWVDVLYGFTIYQECSKCGAERPHCDYFPEYCPNCGAKMNEEKGLMTETRTIDHLHRIAIPKKMCDAIDIKIGDTVEITLVDKHIVLKKWEDAE